MIPNSKVPKYIQKLLKHESRSPRGYGGGTGYSGQKVSGCCKQRLHCLEQFTSAHGGSHDGLYFVVLTGIRKLKIRLQASPAWENHDLVFSNLNGKFFNPSHLGTGLHKLLRKSEAPMVRFHDLCTPLQVSFSI